eukprot:m.9797 g.9797  ORF g.9797 m.9797 type:complete len:55 (-) comp7000_c0_seq2:220-384(-)
MVMRVSRVCSVCEPIDAAEASLLLSVLATFLIFDGRDDIAATWCTPHLCGEHAM